MKPKELPERVVITECNMYELVWYTPDHVPKHGPKGVEFIRMDALPKSMQLTLKAILKYREGISQ
jgi:hypothetical protein